jgi:twitching motility protein PilU
LDRKRVAALEILMDTPRVRDLIRKGDVDILKEAMEQGVQEGCQTFDQALFMLYKEGKVSLDQALINADSANNLRLKIKLAGLKGDEETDPPAAPANGNRREDPKLDPLKSNSAFRLQRT